MQKRRLRAGVVVALFAQFAGLGPPAPSILPAFDSLSLEPSSAGLVSEHLSWGHQANALGSEAADGEDLLRLFSHELERADGFVGFNARLGAAGTALARVPTTLREEAERMLLRRISAWVGEDRRSGEYADARNRLDLSLEELERALLYTTDQAGTVLLDDLGDPVLKGVEEFAEASELWERAVEQQSQEIAQARERSSAKLLLEVLDTAARLGFDGAPHEMQIARFLELQNERRAHEQRVLVQHARNRFVAGRLRDTYSLRRKSEQETAMAVRAELVGETAEELGVLTERLSESVRTAVDEHGTPDAGALEALERGLQDALEEGIGRWAEAERELLLERARWEQEAADAFGDGERAWQAVLEELNRRRGEWFNQLSEVVAETERYWDHRLAEYRDESQASLAAFEQASSFEVAQFVDELEQVTEMLELHRLELSVAQDRVSEFRRLVAGALQRYARLAITNSSAARRVLLEELQPYRNELSFWQSTEHQYRTRINELLLQIEGLEQETRERAEHHSLDTYSVEKHWIDRLLEEAEQAYEVAAAVLGYASDESSKRPTHSETKEEYERAAEELEHAYEEAQQLGIELEDLASELGAGRETLQSHREKLIEQYQELTNRRREYEHALEIWSDLDLERLLKRVDQRVAALVGFYRDDKARLYQAWIESEEDLSRLEFFERSRGLTQLLRLGEAADPGGGEHEMPALETLRQLKVQFGDFAADGVEDSAFESAHEAAAQVASVAAYMGFEHELAVFSGILESLPSVSAAKRQAYRAALEASARNLSEILAAEVLHREYAIGILSEKVPWGPDRLQSERESLSQAYLSALRDELAASLSHRSSIVEVLMGFAENKSERIEAQTSEHSDLYELARTLWNYRISEHQNPYSLSELTAISGELETRTEQIEQLVAREHDLQSLLEGLWTPFTAYGVRLLPMRVTLDTRPPAVAIAGKAAALEQYASQAFATVPNLRREVLHEVAQMFREYAEIELVGAVSDEIPEPSLEQITALELRLKPLGLLPERGETGEDAPESDEDYGLGALRIAIEVFLSSFREPEVTFDRGRDDFMVVDRRAVALSVLHHAYDYVSRGWEEPVTSRQDALEDALRLAEFHESELHRARASYTENHEEKQRALEDLNSAGERRATYYRNTVAPARSAVVQADTQYRAALNGYRLAIEEFAERGELYGATREIWEQRVSEHRAAGFKYARARGVYEYASDGYVPAGFDPKALRDARYAEYRRLQRIADGLDEISGTREDASESVTDEVLLELHERSYELADMRETIEQLETVFFASMDEIRTERDVLAIRYHDAFSEVFRMEPNGTHATPGLDRNAPELPDYRALSPHEMLEEAHLSAYLEDARYLADAKAFATSLLEFGNPQRVLRDLGYAFYHEMQSVEEYEIDINVVNDGALRSLIDERRIISGGGPRRQIRSFAAREAERGFNRVQSDPTRARLYAVYRQLMLADRFTIGERFIQNDLGGAVIDEARDEARKRIRRNRRRQRKFLAGFFVSRSSIIGAAILESENRKLRALRRSVSRLSPEGRAQRNRQVAEMRNVRDIAAAYRETHYTLVSYLHPDGESGSESGDAIAFEEFSARFAELPGAGEHPELHAALPSLSHEFGMLSEDDRRSFADAVRALETRIHNLLQVNLADRNRRLNELSYERDSARRALAAAAADGLTRWEQLEPLANVLFADSAFSEQGYQALVQQTAEFEASEGKRTPSSAAFIAEQRADAAARLYRHVVALDFDQQSRESDLTHRRILDERAHSIDRLHSLYETSAAAWSEAERALRNDRDAWRRRYAREYELASESWELHWQQFQAERQDWIERAVEHTVRQESERLATVLGRRPEVLLQDLPIAGETPSFRGAEQAADSLQTALGGLRLGALLDQAVGTRESIMLPANAFARHVRPERFTVTRLALQAETGIHEARRRLATASALQLHALRREAHEHMERAVHAAERDLSHQVGGTLESVGFRRRGQWYEREAISGSSLLGGTRYSTQRIRDYRSFEIPDLGIRVALDPERLRSIGPERVEEKAHRLRAELELHAEIVIGFRWAELDLERAGAVPADWISLLRRETQTLVRDAAQRAAANEGFDRAGAGLLGLHVGWAPQEQGNGYGELGRIFGDLREFEEERAEGLALIETPIWHQPIWDDSSGFVAAPSLQQVGSVAAGIGGALIGGPAGVALAAGTAATFGAADVIDGYQDLGEAGLQVGVTTAGSAVGMGVGAAFSGATAAAGSVDGLWGVAAETAVSGARVTTAHAAHSALGALEYDNGVFLSTDRIWSSLTSSEALALYASGVGAAAVESSLRLANAAPSHTVGFSTADLNRLNELNRAAGAVTGAGIEFALTGATGVSVLNLADLGREIDQRMGLATVKLGDGGAGVALGPGGHDLSIGRAASAAGGVALWRDNRRIARYSDGLERNLASALRAVRSYGDDAGRELFERLLDGTDVVRFGLDEGPGGALAVTEQGQNGGRVLRLANLGDSTSDALRYALLLQHEAHRDGVVDTDNLLETRESVAAHTQMSASIMQDERYGYGAFGLDSNLALQIALAEMDAVALDAYADAVFDSSGDYWRLMEDGSLEFDGDGWLRNPNGHYILDRDGNRIGAQGVQGGLQRILGISDLEAVRMLQDSGFTHLGAAPWWNHEGNEGLSLTLDNPGYAALYHQKLDHYNPLTIYNRLVEFGAMDVKRINYGTTVSVRGDWTGRLPDIEYITYEQYKAQNYITSPPQVWATMPIPLAPRDEAVGKWGVTSPFGPRDYAGTSFHYGTDFRAVEGTELRPMFPGFVPEGGLQLDEDTPAGISITLQHETPEYLFMGMPRQDAFFTRYAHLQDSIDEQSLAGRLLPSQVMAATGNTGRPLTGPHLHAELYTESQHSPLLDLMLDHSEQRRRYHYARNLWYYDLESFIDRDLFPIYYPLE